MALGILLVTCLTVHARYYRNPFRRSLTVETKEDVSNAGAVVAPSNVDILLRNLVVGPPRGAERIMLKVSSDKDGTSDEIAAIMKEIEDQIKRRNRNDENPKTERIINVVEDIDSGNDFNQQKGAEAGNADSNSEADGRQSNEPNKTDSDTNNNKFATSEQNNKNRYSSKSVGKAADSDTTSKPIANNSKSAKNSNAGETNTSAANDIKKNISNNANKASANDSTKDNEQQQQQPGNGGSEGNVIAINGPAAKNSDSDSQSNEGQNADGNNASVERSARNTKKSEGNNAVKLISGYGVTAAIHPAENLRE